MIAGGGGARLALETFERLRVACQLLRKEFHGDRAAEARVFGSKDHTHTAAADFFQDAIMRNGLAEHECGSARPAILGGGGTQVNAQRTASRGKPGTWARVLLS